MVTSDLNLLTPDEKMGGVNIARTIRLIAKLLMDWCDSQEKKNKFLTAIYFDKLAEFFCRIWDHLFEQGQVRFPSSFRSRQGFHGPGRAIKINRSMEQRLLIGRDPNDYRHHELAYMTEIVEKLKPSLGEARILFNVSDNPPPWDYRCRISHQLEPSLWESWLRETEATDENMTFLTAREHDYLLEISRLICLLDKEEIRAIGTHQSSRITCKNIKFNLRAWFRSFENILQFLQNNANLGRSGDIIVNTAREVLDKSNGNRKYYEDALEIILDNIGPGDLRVAISYIQKPATKIWEDEEVLRFRDSAQDLIDLSIYCRRGLIELGGMPKLKKKWELQESEKSGVRLKDKMSHWNIPFYNYEKIKSLNKALWAMNLYEIKRKVFRYMPIIEDRRELGIDDT